MDAASKRTLDAYQRQNAECRNRLYADYMKDRPHHLHPLGIAVMGAVLGALVTAAIFLVMRRDAE